jgi:hypothetical protein
MCSARQAWISRMKNEKQAMQNAKRRSAVLHFALPVLRFAFR